MHGMYCTSLTGGMLGNVAKVGFMERGSFHTTLAEANVSGFGPKTTRCMRVPVLLALNDSAVQRRLPVGLPAVQLVSLPVRTQVKGASGTNLYTVASRACQHCRGRRSDVCGKGHGDLAAVGGRADPVSAPQTNIRRIFSEAFRRPRNTA
jgi:hypothetical protein